MNNLLNEEYLHIGTDHIYKDLWLNIHMDQIKYHSKPFGGLWTSHTCFKYNRLCNWLDYIEEKDKIFYERVSYEKSCLVKFKKNINFLKILSENDFKNLIDSGFTKKDKVYTNLLDFEKIADYYDLLYVNYEADKSFSKFYFNTMLALNPNAIDYYKRIKLDYYNHKVLKIGNKHNISNYNKEYYLLLDFISKHFKDINFDGNYNNYVYELSLLKKEIVELTKKEFKDLNYPNNINKNEVIETIANNIYHDKYKEKQKKLV